MHDRDLLLVEFQCLGDGVHCLRTSGLTAQQHLADVVGQHGELLDVPPLRGLVVDTAGSPDVHPLHHADRIVVLGEAELWIPGVVGSVEQVVPVPRLAHLGHRLGQEPQLRCELEAPVLPVDVDADDVRRAHHEREGMEALVVAGQHSPRRELQLVVPVHERVRPPARARLPRLREVRHERGTVRAPQVRVVHVGAVVEARQRVGVSPPPRQLRQLHPLLLPAERAAPRRRA